MNDALARLRNRSRPTVPNRDASLTSGDADISTSRNQDLESQDSSVSKSMEARQKAELGQAIAATSQASPSKEASTYRYPDIEISTLSDIESFDTKQSTLRLEAGLSDRLQSLCRSEGICREVLIEALFEYFETHPDAKQEILLAAQAKNEYRQQIANLKRAQSMMKRFGGGS